MDTIQKGFEYFKTQNDITHFLMGVFLIMAMVIAIVTLVQKFAEIIGHPIKHYKDTEHDHKVIFVAQQDIEALKKKEQADVEQSKKQRTQISNALAQLKLMVLHDRCERIRSEIINFSAQLYQRDIRQDEYRHIFNLYAEYEKLLKETGMQNGQTDASMRLIKEAFSEHLKKGFDE